MPENKKVIGKASATEKEPTSSEKFSFWLAPGVMVNPFDIVEAQQTDKSTTYGLVTNIEHTTDAPTHLANFISNNFGDLTEEPNTPRQGATVAKVNVMKNSNDIYMPLNSESLVNFADSKGIEIALGIDTMAETDRIPAGIIELSNDTNAIAYIDKRFTIGPESAHINISGISGLATKTSYAMFIIQSMLQKLDSQDIAVVILNVKHGDLLHINEPNESLKEEDRQLWKSLGLDYKPFDNVHYYLPRKYDGYGPNSQNPPDDYKMYAYELKDMADKLDLLFCNIPDPSSTIESLVGEISNGLQELRDGRGGKYWEKVHDWDSLLNGPPLVDDSGKSVKFGDVAASSVGRFRRQLRRIVKTRQTGIFVSNRSRSEYVVGDEIYKDLEGGHTFVVDIALLNDEEQTLVFGDVIKTIYNLFSEGGEGRQKELPKKVLIFVDELNKFAPAREKTSAIVEQILDIAERGRSLGLILISAQQFLSAVHPRVTGNAATLVLGRTGSQEISSANYRFLDEDLKLALTRLGKGELIIQHPIYRQPVKIKFPKPAYKQL